MTVNGSQLLEWQSIWNGMAHQAGDVLPSLLRGVVRGTGDARP